MLPYILEQPLIECYYDVCGENGRTLCNGGNPLGVNRKRKKRVPIGFRWKKERKSNEFYKKQFDTLFKKMNIVCIGENPLRGHLKKEFQYQICGNPLCIIFCLSKHIGKLINSSVGSRILYLRIFSRNFL